jgi:hypothetical protein
MLNRTPYQNDLNDFYLKLSKLIEEYEPLVPMDELGYQIINQGTILLQEFKDNQKKLLVPKQSL